MQWKRHLALGLTLLLAMACAACGGGTGGSSDGSTVDGIQETVTGHFEDMATVEEATETAGFTMNTPPQLGDLTQRTIQSAAGQATQVIYSDGPLDDEATTYIQVRKEPLGENGGGEPDTSGYEAVRTEEFMEYTITILGDEDLDYQATWDDGAYRYTAYGNRGMDQNTIFAVVGLFTDIPTYSGDPNNP